MAKARDPNRDKAKEIYDNNPGIELTEIASQLNIPVTTVRSWKARDKWECNATQCNASNRATQKPFDDGTKETMLNESLTHEQRLFCIYYSKIFNATQSYQKAYGCTYESAMVNGSNLLRNIKVKEELQRLNEIKRQQIIVSETDLVELHMRMAFADIGNYISFKQEEIPVMTMFGYLEDKETGKKVTKVVNSVKVNDSANVDTQLIQEVKQGKDGFSIKLADRQKSMDWLDKHFLMNPMDKHKVEYDMLKLELERKKLDPNETTSGARYNGLPATMIAPAFIKVVHDIEEQLYNEYVFPGGRGSAKSSFISLEIIDLIEKNPDMHAAVFRQVGNTLRDSVYAQICWAIAALGLEDEYKCNVSPLEITKKSTGQKIFFRGNDDPMKSKGIKAPALKKEAIRRIKVNKEKLKALNKPTEAMKVESGYIGILWFEELDQFKGAEAVRTVTQSVVRGGEKTYIFKSFNPPKSANNWANKYIKIPKPGMLVTFSNYLDVPKSWLGKPFLDDAEHLKEVNPTAYENEYMGVANGTGGNVFDNVTIRKITDEEIAVFDRLYFGVDWGWFPDPWAFNKMYYNAAQHRLVIIGEDRRNKTKNAETARILREEHGITPNDKITCDSAEEKSVSDYKDYGLFARGAIKGPGSVDYSMKWLASLAEIVIDNTRTPHTATEFLEYEYERDKEGNIISGYPDKNNHHIDAIRYALEEIWRRRGQ
ncbi:MAG TPA: PBSX family phage terminase large subunit [Clostridiales bacterium]|nr:PBSX family phage terminase large subunit [Clostridiales bacterium]